MNFKDKILWFCMLLLSALNAVGAIDSFNKYPLIAIFQGIVSIYLLKKCLEQEKNYNREQKPMEKIVATLREDPDLDSVCQRINQRKLFANKKLSDFQKQMDEQMKALHKENEADWELVKTWLRNKGRLPTDFNDQTHNISFNVKDNGVRVVKNSGMFHNMPIKHKGSFQMEDLPPELQKGLKNFIEQQDREQ